MFAKMLAGCILMVALAFCGLGMRFAVLSDPHITPGNANVGALERAVAELNAAPVDFVLVPGDLTNQGGDAELAEIKRILDELTMPYYVVPGNHETNWSESAAQRFIELWGTDRFFFLADGVAFVGFSTGPYLKMGDGFVRREDLEWLRETLRTALPQGVPVVVTTHYPLGDGLSNWSEVIDILRPYDVRLAICGHWHTQRQLNLNGIFTVVCRALDQGGNQGYTLFDWTREEFSIGEKPLGEAVRPCPVQVEETCLQENPPLNRRWPEGVWIEEVTHAAASVFTGVVVSADAFYFGTSTGECVAAGMNGRTCWEREEGGAVYSTPVTAGDIVVFGTVKDGILGLRTTNGAPVWKIAGVAPVINDGVIADGDLFMGLGAREFARIDPADGTVRWRWSGAEGIFQGRPAVGDGAVVFGAWDGHLYCLDAADGRERWRWRNGDGQKLFSPGNVVPVIAQQKVFIVTPDRCMTAIDLADGRTRWQDRQYPVRESLGGSPDGSTVYAKTMDGKLIAVDAAAADFQLKWVTDLTFGYEHNPCPILEVDGVVYAGSRAGVVAAVNAADGALLYTVKLGNAAVNRFTAAPDGAVWLTLIDGAVFRLENEKTSGAAMTGAGR